jgi:methylthioribose-1-phosphate isomerase
VDWTLDDGRDIPIEERDGDEVTKIQGKTATGEVVVVEIVPEGAHAGNPAFDVTPSRLVTGLITERGVCDASKAGLAKLFPELA